MVNQDYGQRPQDCHLLLADLIFASSKLHRRDVRQVRPQQQITVATNLVVAEVKLLDGRELGQVWPQRLSTIKSDIVAAQVKLLDG